MHRWIFGKQVIVQFYDHMVFDKLAFIARKSITGISKAPKIRFAKPSHLRMSRSKPSVTGIQCHLRSPSPKLSSNGSPTLPDSSRGKTLKMREDVETVCGCILSSLSWGMKRQLLQTRPLWFQKWILNSTHPIWFHVFLVLTILIFIKWAFKA